MGSQNKSISNRHLNSAFISAATTFFFLLYVTSLQQTGAEVARPLSSFNKPQKQTRNWTRGSTVTISLNTATHNDRVHIIAPELQYLNETIFGSGTLLAVQQNEGNTGSQEAQGFTFSIDETDGSSQIQT